MKINRIFLLTGGAALIVMYGLFDPAQHFFPQCPMRTITGLLCPGCGSQRALHQALHGNFAMSMQFNFLLLPAAFYGLISMIGPFIFSHNWSSLRMKFFGSAAAYIALGIIMIYWVGRNLI